MSLPVAIDVDLARTLRDLLRTIIDNLTTAANHQQFGASPGLRDALSTILHAVRELDDAVLPPAAAPLPSDAALGWVQPLDKRPGCIVLPDIDLESARVMTEQSMSTSQALNGVLAEIQRRLRSRQAPPDLVKRFGLAMGYLFTEICIPLYRRYPELEPEWLARPEEKDSQT